MCLTAMHKQFSGQYDKRSVTKLWDLLKKLPGSACVNELGMSNIYFWQGQGQALFSIVKCLEKYKFHNGWVR